MTLNGLERVRVKNTCNYICSQSEDHMHVLLMYIHCCTPKFIAVYWESVPSVNSSMNGTVSGSVIWPTYKVS